jgi:hypothetical protein
MATSFEPVTLADVKSALGKVLPLGSLDQVAPRLGDMPARNTVAIVGLTSLVFFMAERGKNPKVNTIVDASIYCSTCRSVGYADIHPVTPVGKLVGTFIMTVGPSLVSKMLDGPASARRDALQTEILAKLAEILNELQEQNASVGRGDSSARPPLGDADASDSPDGK